MTNRQKIQEIVGLVTELNLEVTNSIEEAKKLQIADFENNTFWQTVDNITHEFGWESLRERFGFELLTENVHKAVLNRLETIKLSS